MRHLAARFGSAIAIALALTASAVPGWAQQVPAQRPAAEEGPRWAALTPAQRQTLAPLEADWAGIDAPRKQKWLQLAGRMTRMSPEERERIRERMAAWSRLTPAERGRARAQFLEAQQLSAEDRLARWEAYQALPAEKRQALASQAAPKAPATAPTRSVPGGPTSTVGKAQVNTAPAPKRNVVEPSALATIKPVAPTVVQVKPGATTTLVSRPANPPAHHQPGLPKIAAAPGMVNPTTLLPLKGPQAASAPGRVEPAPTPAPEPEPTSEP